VQKKVEPAPAIIKPAPAQVDSLPAQPKGKAPQPGTLSHKVGQGETLFSISKKYGVAVEDLKKWNNIGSDNSIAVGQELVVLEKMTGEAGQPKAKVTQPGTVSHRVSQGETLFSISKKYGVAVEDLKKWNNIGSDNIISVGQELVVFVDDWKEATEATVQKKEDSGVDTAKLSPARLDSVPAQEQVLETQTDSVYHTVSRGETLFAISRLYGVSVDELIAWNSIGTDNIINVGQAIVVSSSSIPSNRVFHIVSQGETLYSLSKKYGVTVEELMVWNHIGSDFLIIVDQKLVVLDRKSVV